MKVLVTLYKWVGVHVEQVINGSNHLLEINESLIFSVWCKSLKLIYYFEK